jgi:replicative DNA helicase
VLADAEARRLQREATGRAVLGVSTGLGQLDSLLGGLNDGLHLLAGPPGMGIFALTPEKVYFSNPLILWHKVSHHNLLMFQKF